MSETEYPRPIDPPEMVKELADGVGGRITECAALPDGSGFAIMSMPLRTDHWIYEKGADGFCQPPPMPFRMGSRDHVVVAMFPNEGFPHRHTARLTKNQFAQRIRDAAKYAVRGATMHGEEMDFDPDALLQNLIVGMLGYWTADGLSSDTWANPAEEYRDREPAVSNAQLAAQSQDWEPTATFGNVPTPEMPTNGNDTGDA
jgi:hypothetical protein